MITSGNCMAPEQGDERLSDYLSKVSRSGPDKPVTIASIFPFYGEVDPVIAWKQSFRGYDPKLFPMSSFGGHWLRIEYPDRTLLAAPGDYVIRTTEGEYYPIGADKLLVAIREDNATQPEKAGLAGSELQASS